MVLAGVVQLLAVKQLALLGNGVLFTQGKVINLENLEIRRQLYA